MPNPAMPSGWGDPYAATAPPAIPEEKSRMRAPSQAPAAPAVRAPSGAPPGVDPGVHAATRPGGADLAPTPDGARVLAGFLVSFEGNECGTFWPLYQGRTLVGRKDAADGLDLEIDHPTTSSRHATLVATARPGRLEVEDLGSTNGTFIQDEKIPSGVRYELKDGVSLRFGGYPVIVKLV